MKSKIRTLLVCALMALLSAPVFAQDKVTVTVKDDVGPVPGANVMVKGTTIGAMTDIDGVAVVSPVNEKSVLVVSFIGYETVEVTVGKQSTITVTMQTDSEQLEESVSVGFAVQKKSSLTSAISNINAEDITSTKQNDLVASLQGKVPGLQIRQQGGMAGFFDADLSLRGYGEPMVIIDGVARTGTSMSTTYGRWGRNQNSGAAALAALNPEDIEDIVVLKDASAAVYGIGAQNGVILVTTKKGQVGTPSVRLSARYGFAVPTAWPKEVGIVDYLELENEMALNSKRAIPYTQEYIDHYRNGDPGYVDFSWIDYVMRDVAVNQTYNAEISGGTQQTTYRLSANFSDNQQNYKSTAANFKNYGFTAAFSAQLSPKTKVSFNSSMSERDLTNPSANTSMNIWYYLFNSYRTIPAKVYGDDTLWAINEESRNIAAELDGDTAGYDMMINTDFRNNLDLNSEDLFGLKGLKLQVSGAYDMSIAKDRTLALPFNLYDYNTGRLAGKTKDTPSISEERRLQQRLYGRAQLNYNTSIQGVHNIGATLAAETTVNRTNNLSGSRQYLDDFFTQPTINMAPSTNDDNGGTRSETATAGYVGRLSYNYSGKYLAEVTARYDGTYMYEKGSRWGLFPAYSLGWRVSDESWFKELLPKMNNLKLRWSDGNTGRAQGSAYQYLLGYSTSGNYIYNDGNQVPGYVQHAVKQTITWAHVRMMDFGFDFEAYKGLIGGSFDWFWRETKGTSAAPSAQVPDYYGMSLANVPLNSSENLGLEWSIYHRNSIGKFNYRAQFTGTFSRSRNTYTASQHVDNFYYASSNAKYSAGNADGRWSGAHGTSTYKWEGGRFDTWNEINDYKVMHDSAGGSNMLPGMYKLQDRNGDGIINNSDLYYVWGEANSPLQLGATFSGSYKNLSVNVQLSMGALTNKQNPISGGFGFGYFKTYYVHNLDRFKLADGYTDPFDPQSKWESGYWPAIAKAVGAYDTSSNATYRKNQPYNFVNSTFLRIKSIDVNYTFKGDILKKMNLKGLTLTAGGTNLLTICNKLLSVMDPERRANDYMGVGGSPIMKNYTLGATINF